MGFLSKLLLDNRQGLVIAELGIDQADMVDLILSATNDPYQGIKYNENTHIWVKKKTYHDNTVIMPQQAGCRAIFMHVNHHQPISRYECMSTMC